MNAAKLLASILGTFLGWMIAQLVVVVLLKDSLSMVPPQNRETQWVLLAMGIAGGLTRVYVPRVHPWLITLAVALSGTVSTILFIALTRGTTTLGFIAVDFLRWFSGSLMAALVVRVLTYYQTAARA